MNETDPFLSLLEKSLEVPDFELGQDARDLLLSAAGGVSMAGATVVQFVQPDEEAQAAFDWLMGERSADRALMESLTTRPGFMEAVAAEKQFMRMMRNTLRPAPVAVSEPRRRGMATMIGSIAAAIALLLSFSVLNPFGVKAPVMVTQAAGPSAVSEQRVARLLDEPGRLDIAPQISVPRAITMEPDFKRVPSPTIGTGEVHPGAAAAEGIPELFDLKKASALAARELFSAPPAWLDLTLGWTGSDSDYGSLALTGGDGGHSGPLRSTANWEHHFTAGYDGESPYSGGQGVNVPEPSSFLPVLVSGAFLLFRRRRGLPHQTE